MDVIMQEVAKRVASKLGTRVIGFFNRVKKNRVLVQIELFFRQNSIIQTKKARGPALKNEVVQKAPLPEKKFGGNR